MLFRSTPLEGAFLIEPEPMEDARGSFARVFCEREFKAHGISMCAVQCNVSSNVEPGTLRGMHYQSPPHAEAKLVRCMRGRMYDVIVDLRRKSSTFRKWFAVELQENGGPMLYIPEGFAHGFQTLEPHTEVFYWMGAFYERESTRGVRYDDPAFGIRWPLANPVMSDRDASFPWFDEKTDGF